MSLTIPRLALVALTIAAFWTLWGFPIQNGLLELLGDLKKPGAVIPGPTPAPMKQKYTGIKFVDGQLTILVGFFITAVDGNRADISLSGMDLAGQVFAAWMLITIEAYRYGNKGLWYITATTLIGFILQNIGYACVAPIWALLQLWKSPTVAATYEYDLQVPPLQLAIAPLSVLIGFGTPSVLMTLAAPSVISFEQKQFFAAMWQGWPIWVAVTQLILGLLIAGIGAAPPVMTEDDKSKKSMQYLRRAYAFAVIGSSAGHILVRLLSAMSFVFPGLFTQPYATQMQPIQVLGLVWPFLPLKALSIGDGALWFLQYDCLIGSAAIVVWALSIGRAAKGEENSLKAWLIATIKVLLLSFFVGPCGAAVLAVWGRDEYVYRQAAINAISEKKSL